MTDKAIAKKVVDHLRAKGIMAIVNIGNKCISTILHNNRGKQYCFLSEDKKDLLNKTRFITSSNVI